MSGDHVFFQGQQGFANHNPLFRAGPDIRVVEGSGQYGPSQWCFDPRDGEGPRDAMNRMTHSGRQSLWFDVAAASPELFRGQDAPRLSTEECQLTFSVEPGQCGVSSVKVVLHDSGNPNCIDGVSASTGEVFTCPGACAPDDCSVSAPADFHITVVCVNDPPSFRHTGDVVVRQNGGSIVIPSWAHTIEKGVASGAAGMTTITPFEHAQRLRFVVTNDNPSLFTVAPHIRWDGRGMRGDPSVADLAFTLRDGWCGEAVVSVSLSDDGGTDNGGADTMEPPEVFKIRVECVASQPTYTAGTTLVVVEEDHGMWCQDGWASQVVGNGAGSGRGGNNHGSFDNLRFEVVFADPADAVLFLVPPSVDVMTGRLCFQTHADLNTFASGDVDVWVRLVNDESGLASCRPITTCPKVSIRVTPVNDPPTATCGPNIIVCENMANLATTPDHTDPRGYTLFSDGVGWLRQLSVGPPNEGVCPGCEGQRLLRIRTEIMPDLNTGGNGALPNPSFGGKGLFWQGEAPAVSAVGDLTFKLANDRSGVAVVRVVVEDTGVDDGAKNRNGKNDVVCTFTVTVLAVGQPPTFSVASVGATNPATGRQVLEVEEDAAPVSLNSFVLDVRRGGASADEDARDKVRFLVGYDLLDGTEELFEIAPLVEMTGSTTGRLAFALRPDACGRALLRIVAEDTSLNGRETDRCNLPKGRSQSEPTLVELLVRCRNDPPSFAFSPCPNCCAPTRSSPLLRAGAAALGGGVQWTCPDKLCTITVCEDEAAGGIGGAGYVLSRFIAEADVGGGADEKRQRLRYSVSTDAADLFLEQPTVSEQGELRFAARKNAHGDARVYVTAEDYATGPTLPGDDDLLPRRTEPLPFLLRILPANDPPTFHVNPAAQATIVGAGSSVVECRAADGGCAVPPGGVSGSSGGGCLFTIANLFGGIGPGGAGGGAGDPEQFARGEELEQDFRFEVSTDAPEMFAVGGQPQVSKGGSLSFVLKPGGGTTDRLAQGLMSLRVEMKDTGSSAAAIFAGRSQRCEHVDTTVVRFNMQVAAAAANNGNQCFRCSHQGAAVVDVMNNVRDHALLGFATGVAAKVDNDPVAGGAGVRLSTVSATNAAFLFEAAPVVSPEDGTLRFRTRAHACGRSDVVVERSEESPAGVFRTQRCSFAVVVHHVNAAPSFVGRGDVESEEDAGEVCVQWVESASPGPFEGGSGSGADATCAAQTVRYEVSAGAGGSESTADLFVAPPSLSPAGLLCFRSRRDACGNVALRVRARDDGGVLRGGVDLSEAVLLRIRVLCINDAPTYARGGTPAATTRDLRVCSDAGPQLLSQWCRDPSPGPQINEDCPPHRQRLSFVVSTNDTSLFADAPTVSPDTCALAYAPRAGGAGGVAEVRVRLCDDGPAHPSPPHAPCSADEVFRVTVDAASPRLGFSLLARHVYLPEDAAAAPAPGGGGVAVALRGLLRDVVGLAEGAVFSASIASAAHRLVVEEVRLNGTTGDAFAVLRKDAHGPAKVRVCLTAPPRPVGSACAGGGAPPPSVCDTLSILVAPCDDPPEFLSPAAVEPRLVAAAASGGDAFLAPAVVARVVAGAGERGQSVSVSVVTPAAALPLFLEPPTLVRQGGGGGGAAAREGDVFDLRYRLDPAWSAVVGRLRLPLTLRATDDAAGTHPAFAVPGLVGADAAGVVCGPPHAPVRDAPLSVAVAGGLAMPQPFAAAAALVTQQVGVPFRAAWADVSGFGNSSGFVPPNPQKLPGFDAVMAWNPLAQDASVQVSYAFRVVRVSDRSLFAAAYNGTLPAVDATSGELSFVGGASGRATVEIVLERRVTRANVTVPGTEGRSAPFTLTIVLTEEAADTLPTVLTRVVTVDEDAGSVCAAAAVAVPTAAAAGATLPTLHAGSGCCGGAAYFATAPHVTAAGDVCFEVRRDRFFADPAGVPFFLKHRGALVAGGGGGGGGAPWYENVTIRVRPVNDPPSFGVDGDAERIVLAEDQAELTLRGFFTGVTAGPHEDGFQAIRFNLSCDEMQHFDAPPRASVSTGDLVLRPAPDSNGVGIPLIVSLVEEASPSGGWAAAAAPLLRHTRLVFVDILPVNDPPTVRLANRTIRAVRHISSAVAAAGGSTGGNAFEFGAFFRALNPGPVDEWGQRLLVAVEPKRTDLFRVAPFVNEHGALLFTLREHSGIAGEANRVYGSYFFNVTVTDDGGVARGGVDRSSVQFLLQIVDVFDGGAGNDTLAGHPDIPSAYFPRTLVAAVAATDGSSGAPPEVAQPWVDVAGLRSIGFFSFLSSGPADDAADTLAFHVECAPTNVAGLLFLRPPAISPVGVLTYTLRAYAWGDVACAVEYGLERRVASVAAAAADAPSTRAADATTLRFVVPAPPARVSQLLFVAPEYARGRAERGLGAARAVLASDVEAHVAALVQVASSSEEQRRKVAVAPFEGWGRGGGAAAGDEGVEGPYGGVSQRCSLFRVELLGVATRPLPEEMAGLLARTVRARGAAAATVGLSALQTAFNAAVPAVGVGSLTDADGAGGATTPQLPAECLVSPSPAQVLREEATYDYTWVAVAAPAAVAILAALLAFALYRRRRLKRGGAKVVEDDGEGEAASPQGWHKEASNVPHVGVVAPVARANPLDDLFVAGGGGGGGYSGVPCLASPPSHHHHASFG